MYANADPDAKLVAWCADCGRFLNPPTVLADGTCPTCGKPVEAPKDESGDARDESADEFPNAPWHFKIAVGAVAIYLGFRAVQAIIWLF